jgi:hypothetical protein
MTYLDIIMSYWVLKWEFGCANLNVALKSLFYIYYCLNYCTNMNKKDFFFHKALWTTRADTDLKKIDVLEERNCKI